MTAGMRAPESAGGQTTEKRGGRSAGRMPAPAGEGAHAGIAARTHAEATSGRLGSTAIAPAAHAVAQAATDVPQQPGCFE